MDTIKNTVIDAAAAYAAGDKEKYDKYAAKGEEILAQDAEACHRHRNHRTASWDGSECVAIDNTARLAAMYPVEWCKDRNTDLCKEARIRHKEAQIRHGRAPRQLTRQDPELGGGKRKRRTRKPKKHNKKSKKYHKKRSYKKTYRKH